MVSEADQKVTLSFARKIFSYGSGSHEKGDNFLVYKDVFGIDHEDCHIVQTRHEFNRIFIIENEVGSRFTCIKKDAPLEKKMSGHWKYAKASDAPKNYAVPYKAQKN